jgi:hypothetical protein
MESVLPPESLTEGLRKVDKRKLSALIEGSPHTPPDGRSCYRLGKFHAVFLI